MTKSINILTKFGINPIKTTKVKEPKHLWREREKGKFIFQVQCTVAGCTEDLHPSCCHPKHIKKQLQLECGPMPNLMVALPNIGGALCSTPQSLADAHY